MIAIVLSVDMHRFHKKKNSLRDQSTKHIDINV